MEQLSDQIDALAEDRRFDRHVLRFRIDQLAAILSWRDECAPALAAPDTCLADAPNEKELS